MWIKMLPYNYNYGLVLMISKRTHLFIPDAQVRHGVPTDHLRALGNYIVDKQPDVIVNIGDFADMASLSSYEKPGSKYMENMRYKLDIDSAKEAMNELLLPMKEYNKKQRKNKHKPYKPEMHMFLGNHEDRINRALNADPIHLEGVISMDDLEYEKDWIVHPFLVPHIIDGVAYCHYFVNPNGLTGHPVGGTIMTKLNNLKCSFSMGHQQQLQYGMSYDGTGKRLHGLVAGSFYQHDEGYMGPQKNQQHWRGVVMKHEVADGQYDPMFVSLDFLLENYL
jgi:hypothetical protein